MTIKFCSFIPHIMVKFSRYRFGVAQRLGRGIALLFHDRGSRKGWVVSSTPWPHFTPGKDPVPIVQEPGWAPGPVWTGGKSRPHRDSISDRPARSQSLYRLSYPAHFIPHILDVLRRLFCYCMPAVVGTGASSWVKAAGHDIGHSPPSSAESNKNWYVYITTVPVCLDGRVRDIFTFTFYSHCNFYCLLNQQLIIWVFLTHVPCIFCYFLL